MLVEPGTGLAVALVCLMAITVGVSMWMRLGTARAELVAGIRAVVQLLAVSLVIGFAAQALWSAFAVVFVMFGVATWTAASRAGVRPHIGYSALAISSGAVPVLVVVFATGAAPLTPIALMSLAGIIIGAMMTAHTLAARRCFAEINDKHDLIEAALSLGATQPRAVALVTHPTLKEALFPNLDQTRTVGLVTLPGAFVGVLLGGGSPLQAAAAQVLVLLGQMAGQTITVSVLHAFIIRGRLRRDDLAINLTR